jgi:hypothetical protein
VRAWPVIVGGIVVVALAIVLAVLVRRGDPGVAVTPPRDGATASSDPGASGRGSSASPETARDGDATIVRDPDRPRTPPTAAPDDAAVGVSPAALIAELRTSGAANEKWAEQGISLLRSIAPGRADVTDVGCYVAGCAATLTFRSDAELHRALDDLEGSNIYLSWTGGKKLSAPEQHSDGRVSIALALYRPD